jgi:hypothetical protein
MVGATVSYFSAPFASWPALGDGPAVGLSGGYRWRFLYFGAAYLHTYLDGGTSSGSGGSAVASEQTLWANSDYGGLDVVAITSPDAIIAPFFRVGIGYRVVRWSELDFGYSTPTNKQSSSADLLVGIGLQFNASGWVRIVPQASFELGPLAMYASLGLTTYFDFTNLTR